jgi:predicted nucleic acid-binding protein
MSKKKLIIDANILMSTLITQQGKVAHTFLKLAQEYNLISCQFLYIELFKHKNKILKASKLEENDFLDYLLSILNRIEFISEVLIPQNVIKQAEELVSGIDKRDIYYVALSLHTNAPIWTGDYKLSSGLKEKGFTNFVQTSDFNEHP